MFRSAATSCPPPLDKRSLPRPTLGALAATRVFQAPGSQVEGTHSFTQRKPEYSRSFIYFLFHGEMPQFLLSSLMEHPFLLGNLYVKRNPRFFPSLYEEKLAYLTPLRPLCGLNNLKKPRFQDRKRQQEKHQQPPPTTNQQLLQRRQTRLNKQNYTFGLNGKEGDTQKMGGKTITNKAPKF